MAFDTSDMQGAGEGAVHGETEIKVDPDSSDIVVVVVVVPVVVAVSPPARKAGPCTIGLVARGMRVAADVVLLLAAILFMSLLALMFLPPPRPKLGECVNISTTDLA